MRLLVLVVYWLYHVSSNWIILKEGIHSYGDWNDINRNWNQIKHIHTHNGYNIQRKCTTYFDGNPLCLCQYINKHIQHLCFNQQILSPASPVTFFIIDSFHNQQQNNGDAIIASAIEKGVHFYTQSFNNQLQLPIDSIFLLKLISKNDMQYINIADLYYLTLQSKYHNDYNNPFNRIFSKSAAMTNRFNDLKIGRYQNQKHGEHNLYVVNKKYAPFYVDPTDDVLLKALFCDVQSFDKLDFHILINMANYDGGYEDTHTIIALNVLAVNKCYDTKKIRYAMSQVAKAVLIALNENNSDFGDLFFERIVCLYWSGYGDFIKKEWIVKIAKYQSENDYGWSHDYQRRGKHWLPIEYGSTPHPTGLALLAMIYYEIGESIQSFYPIDSLV